LQAIYSEHGKLTPAIVLDQARDEAHPLHSRFEWDDEVAAERFRTDQAHELIRSVRITYSNTEGVQRDIRAFHAVREDDGFNYRPAEKVVDDPLAREILLRDMEREWRQLFTRFKNFSEFLQIVRKDVAA
jgi:hypothetical protein|tara:strand:- start:4981 stop:5370 length:390 start_codon:yes stop_codon:yes gene_type:complete